MIGGRALRVCRYAGLLAMAIGWATIIVAALCNPWFSVLRHALSDMGSPKSAHPWVFNGGLMIAAVPLAIYAACVAYRGPDRLARASGLVMIAAAVSLFLIGCFPEGAPLHNPVSFAFFILMEIAIFIIGISQLRRGRRLPGLVGVLVLPLGVGTFATIPWPSVATLELFNIALMTCWMLAAALTEGKDDEARRRGGGGR